MRIIPAVLMAGFAMLLAGCDGADVDGQHRDKTGRTGSAAADVTHSDLPDANYANAGLLAARKRGLAQESAQDADPAKTGTIDPIAVDHYTRADYLEVVKKWRALVPTINQERKRAAAIAAKDARCDGVSNAQITDRGTRADRHYMVECNNITRVYFDGKSLADNRAALVRTQADMGAQGVLDW